MKRYRFVLAFVVLSCAMAYGGGSLPSEDVLALVKQNDALWSCLGKTLEFAPTASGARCGNQWTHLGGARMAPYTVLAKPKGASGYTLEIEVACEQRFFDAQGKELPLKDGEVTDRIMKDAATVKEKVTSVRLSPYRAESANADPPAAAQGARTPQAPTAPGGRSGTTASRAAQGVAKDLMRK